MTCGWVMGVLMEICIGENYHEINEISRIFKQGRIFKKEGNTQRKRERGGNCIEEN